ncbi:ComEC family competence protein [Candidatus Peregrinibacteria bacterium]|nr:ComEC family competence protein [Candidatus Peregrinibacteria bacterium]
MKYSNSAVSAILSFLFGVFLAPQVFSLPPYFISGFAVLLAIVFRFWRYPVIFFVIGLARFFLSFPLSSNHIALFNDSGQNIVLEGIVSEEPDRREFSERLVVRAVSMRRVDSNKSIIVKGRVLAILPRYPEHQYGDRLALFGEIFSPESFTRSPPLGSSDENFSYANYLSRYNIYSVMQKPRVSVLAEEEGNVFFALIYRLKEKIETKLNFLFPEPHASFAAGLLLGSRRGLPPALVSAFNTTGLTHIVAVSGYNITLVIMFISVLLKGLRRKYQVVASTMAIAIFVILV